MTTRRFYFGDSDSDTSSTADELALPHPQPLDRGDFLAPDFSPGAYLSSLHNRHQTLEDLRQELRARSQELNRELLDLVNDNYQDFLGLGGSLRGGDERVEEVRLGLLGFRREVEGLKALVAARRGEVEDLLGVKRRVGGEIRLGRRLLELDARLGELEEELALVAPPQINGAAADGAEAGHDGDIVDGFSDLSLTDSDDDEDGEGDEAGHAEAANAVPVSRLGRRAQQYVDIKGLIETVGPSHPFVAKQHHRLNRVRQALLLDLASALRQTAGDGEGVKKRKLKLLAVYRNMDESAEAVKALQEKTRK